ncbi:MAG: hypothetical protein RLZZ400_236 [Actinomycetota bacterium]
MFLRVLTAAAVVLGGLSGTDAAAASQPNPLRPAWVQTQVTNTGQYREGDDPAAFMFDPLVVNRIDLTVPDASIRYMNDHSSGAFPGSHGDYQPAKMTFTRVDPSDPSKNTTTNLLDVGIRLKGGWGSARDMNGKAAFKVKMNFSVKGQTLFGLKKLTLNNMVQDRSMVHEAVGYRLFREAGVPASRTGYARVYVNGVDYGLHLNLETYDSVSLAKRFSSTAHLYEGAYWQDITTSDYDRMQVDEGDTASKTDLAALATVNTIDQGNTTAINNWFTNVQKLADLNELVTEWAVERYLAHWDGYAWQIKNNYYVHFTNEGIASLLPSGIDQTSTGDLSFMDTTGSGIMFQNCMLSPNCRALYFGAVNKVRDAATRLNLPQMAQDVSSAIAADVASDPRKEHSVNDWQWAVDDTMNFHNSRPSVATGATNFNTSSDIKLSYDYSTFNVGDVFTPTFTRGGSASIVWSVVNNSDRCSINSATGAVTVLKSGGWCRVAGRVPTSSGWGSSIAYFTFFGGQAPGSVTIDPIAPLTFQDTAQVNFSVLTSRPVSLSVNGPCKVYGTALLAESGTGSCTVTIDAPADANYTRSSSSVTVQLRKNSVTDWVKASGFEELPKRMPKAGAVVFNRAPTWATGPCKISGRGIRATGDKGTCIAFLKTWSDSNSVYTSQTIRVGLMSGTQTLPSSVLKAGTYKLRDGFVLAKTAEIKTNWGNVADVITDGNCDVYVDETGTAVYGTTGLDCRVTLTVKKSFGLPGLTRVWTLRP